MTHDQRGTGMALGLDHVGIMVTDIDEGVEWYARTFGFELRDRWADSGNGMEWAHLALGGLTLELVKRPGLEAASPASTGYHHVALVVHDCAATVARLESLGVGVILTPSYFDRHDMDWAFVKDTFGNVLEILSYRSRSAGDG